MKTSYENPRLPLGPDICTGGPAARVWAFAMLSSDEYEDLALEQMSALDLHATQGLTLEPGGPLDAPDYLPGGSTKMDWFPRTTMVNREY